MIKGSLRSLLLGTTVSVGLAASAGTAFAVEYSYGDLNIHIDTTLSAGAAARTARRDHTLLPTSNGGPLQDTTGNVNLPAAFVPSNADLSGGTGMTMLMAPATANASINADDGRLNFDRWDMTSGVVKMTNDVSASFQNYKFFGRLTSYYDAVLARDGSYSRSHLVDGQADAVRDIRLLDFYGSADYDVAGMPLNVRAGKQVISWGESTFIQNGINSFNPVDASAVRRPASEIKEFFVPVWALDASIGLPHNLSLEAFYQLKWDTFSLDRAGTPFASSDVATVGSGIGGNYNATSFLTGGPGGNIMRNCTGTNAVSNAFTAAWGTSSNPYASTGIAPPRFRSITGTTITVSPGLAAGMWATPRRCVLRSATRPS
jgi:hypothetical protein